MSDKPQLCPRCGADLDADPHPPTEEERAALAVANLRRHLTPEECRQVALFLPVSNTVLRAVLGIQGSFYKEKALDVQRLLLESLRETRSQSDVERDNALQALAEETERLGLYRWSSKPTEETHK
jgi:hypothetical protein